MSSAFSGPSKTVPLKRRLRNAGGPVVARTTQEDDVADRPEGGAALYQVVVVPGNTVGAQRRGPETGGGRPAAQPEPEHPSLRQPADPIVRGECRPDVRTAQVG